MPSVDDVYRLSIFQQLGGQQVMNTYAFATVTAAYAGADFVTLATDLKELHRTQQAQELTYRSWRAVQLRGTEVTPVQGDCRTEGGFTFEGNYTTSTAGGGSSGAYLPPQSAYVTTLVTGQTGRRRRGRVYAGGYASASQVSGVWTSAFLTPALAAWNTFAAKYIGASATSPVFRLGVWSFRVATGCVRDPNPPYKHIQIDPPNLADAFRLVTGFTPRSTVHSQRRRVVGVGR